ISQILSVHSLTLPSNQIKEIPTEISHLTSLMLIYLADNQIQKIPPEFGQLSQLLELNLWNNLVDIIPSEIGCLAKLTSLEMGANRITFIPSNINQLNQLTDLHLSFNQIRELPKDLFQMARLEVLSLESNSIQSLPDQIKNLKRLRVLNLKNNNLTKLPNKINQLTKLQVLNLSQNRLYQLTEKITDLSSLIELSLGQNNIRFLPSSIENLFELERLHLGGNLLKQLPIELGKLTCLTELDLNENRIYELPTEIGDLKNLVLLNLSQNYLDAIPSSILDLRQLENLNLEGNIRDDIVTDFGKLLTYRQQMEQALEKSRISQKEAEVANQAKSQFLSQMSHEIRTPMNGVIGSLNLMGEEKLNTEEQQHLQRAKSSGQHLLSVINEILQFSALEEGSMNYQQDPFNLVETCQRVLDMLLPLSQQKNLDLHLNYPPTMVGDWIGDEQKIKQVLVNLLGNAIKFTVEGEVQLKLKNINHGIRIEVVDTGIGIAQEQIDTIFESFRQVSQGTSRRFSGTGLGLTISQQFVEGMGGQIGVDSQLSRGSTFWLEIPCKKSNSKSKVADTSSKTNKLGIYCGRKVLIVDDEFINREIVTKYLERLGFSVDQAVEGEDCLKRFKLGRYDLIVMDLQMPVLDGFQTAQQIRRLEEREVVDKRVPILALSASVTGKVWNKCESAGMDGYLSKPFKTEEFQQKVKDILSD
ncbi:ATP-binding protein, partial [Candidatus Poribacteria bacterium]|nr:ATP-binding protein [Candidatus Poribacteria bacterium]